MIAEIEKRRRLYPIDPMPKVDLVQIIFQDLILGIFFFDPDRIAHLPEFPGNQFFSGEKEIFGQLLRDGAPALRRPSRTKHVKGGPDYSAKINTPVFIETTVFHSHHS